MNIDASTGQNDRLLESIIDEQQRNGAQGDDSIAPAMGRADMTAGANAQCPGGIRPAENKKWSPVKAR